MRTNRPVRRPASVRASAPATVRPRLRSTDVLTHAADLLDIEADVLRESHTVRGRWGTDPTDRTAKAIYDDLTGTAKRLRRLARGGHP